MNDSPKNENLTKINCHFQFEPEVALKYVGALIVTILQQKTNMPKQWPIQTKKIAAQQF